MGGLLYPLRTATQPAFVIENAQASLSLVASGNLGYSTVVRETQSGTTGTLSRSTLPGRGTAGFLLPLFRTGIPSAQAAPLSPSSSFF